MNKRLFLVLIVWCAVSSRPALAQDAQNGTLPMVELNRGIELVSMGDHDQARAVFDALLLDERLREEEARACRFYLAICQMRLGDYESAADNLGSAMRGLRRGSPEYESFMGAFVDRGLSLILAGESKEASKVLARYLRKRPEDEAGRMLLGMAQYRCGKFGATVATLQPIREMTDADGKRSVYYPYATYYIGLAQVGRGKVAEGRTLLEEVKDLSLSELAAAAEGHLRVFGTAEPAEVEPFNVRLTLEVGNSYDTNVSLLGRGAEPAQPIGSKDDYRFHSLVDLDLDWRPAEGPLTGWHFVFGGMSYDSWHASMQEFNVQDYEGRASIGRILYEADSGPITYVELGVRYSYDYALVDNDGFLSRNSGQAYAEIHEKDDRWRTYLEYHWEDRDYEEGIYSGAYDRDGNYQSAELAQQFDLWQVPDTWDYSFKSDNERWLMLTVGYRHENNSTQGDEFDFTSHSAFGGVTAPLPWNLEVDLFAEVEWQNYWQRSRIDFDRAGRQDFIQRYSFRLTRKVTEWFSLTGEVSWTDDDSNVVNRLGEDVFSYDRLVCGVNARVSLLNPHQKIRR